MMEKEKLKLLCVLTFKLGLFQTTWSVFFLTEQQITNMLWPQTIEVICKPTSLFLSLFSLKSANWTDFIHYPGPGEDSSNSILDQLRLADSFI